MYFLLIVLLLGGGLFCVGYGLRKTNSRLIFGGLALLVVTPAFFGFLSFWAEKLWFDAIGHPERFWTNVLARLMGAVLGAILGGLVVFGVTWRLPRGSQVYQGIGILVGAFFGLLRGLGSWELVLKYTYGVSTGTKDPILGMDTGFYLFSLPLYDRFYWLIFQSAFVGLIVAIIRFAIRFVDWEEAKPRWQQAAWSVFDLDGVSHALGSLGVVLAIGFLLSPYHLMYSNWGAVAGPGWTDVHIRLPAYYVMSVLTGLMGIAFMVPASSHAFQRRVVRWTRKQDQPGAAFIFPVLGFVVLWFVVVGVIPIAVQWLFVEPNEITMERPYIAHNIKFTRMGFHLDKVEEKEFSVSPELNQETIEKNKHVLSEVRLWDPRALDSVYEQFQEIRLYYQFHDVDTDRYRIDGKYRQVMVSARELELENLPSKSQTFVNRRFKYTHGYGITLAPASDFTDKGLPNLLIKDIPPKVSVPELKIDRPEIYYGELTRTYAVVNTAEAEFDYPSGDDNKYVRYAGKGGVPMGNWWRQFVYGWSHGGTQLLFSTYPTADSRIMFHRNIHNRVRHLAPFLKFDSDAYIVLADGKLYWMIDAYTTSSYFPYSESYFSGESIEYDKAGQSRSVRTGVALYLHGVNYIRNSVKVVVDAYDGSVDFYVFEESDPLIQTWQRIYPGLFKSREEMPKSLEEHIRYPEGFLLAQGLVYAKYHMTDPGVFYNQEDVWVRATEKYYSQVQPVEPYYVMWEPPESDKAEFIIMQPYTPKNRQVLISWLAGMCDPDNYGRLLAYRFTKANRVLGPQQMETKIDQDRQLSQTLTLWDQRGSRVLRGNVLVIPVNSTLLYVEPIYLKAESAAYPELRLVAVMHNDRLSYAENFENALQGLFTGVQPKLGGPDLVVDDKSLKGLAKEANQAFERMLNFESRKEFRKAADEKERLYRALQKMISNSPKEK
ncbi:MAG: UPF0182 family protein [Gemmataceae bacterium]